MDETPDFRVVVRSGQVWVMDWGPWLADQGPMATLMQQRGRAGIALADVTVLRDEEGDAAEAVVAFRTGDSEPAREALRAWAVDTGYQRLWLPEEVVDCELPPGDEASVRCPTCRLQLMDRGPAFWAFVRTAGRFPSQCPLCGTGLPHWSVRDIAPMTCNRADGRRSAARERS